MISEKPATRKTLSETFYKIILFLLLGGCITYYLYSHFMATHSKINVDDILEQSALQHKNFSAQIKTVQADDLHAYLLEEHSVPLVYINFAFQNAGKAHEPEDKQGLTTILADMLLNGAGKYEAVEFKQLCAEYGIKIGFDTNKDNFEGFVAVPSEHLTLAADILHTVLQTPLFDEQYLSISKAQLLKAIQLQMEKPQAVLNDKFAAEIFAGHPYSRRALGEKEQIITLEADDLRKYMQDNLAKDVLIVGIAGDITAQQAAEFMKRAFADLPQQSVAQNFGRLQIDTDGSRFKIERDAAQAVVRFAVQGTYRDSVDFYPLYIANYIFGESGLNSRLSKVIREDNGLTYGIYTFLNINEASALLEGYYSATPENAEKVRELLLEQWYRMAASGISQSELQKAKDALISAYHLRFSSLGDIAQMLVAMQQYNLGQDFLQKRNEYIQAVELSEVNEAAKKYYSQEPDFMAIGPRFKEQK